MTSLVYCIVSVKLKIAALQGLHTLARAYDHSNWEDHLSSIVPQLLTELQVSCAGTDPFVFSLHFIMLSILPSSFFMIAPVFLPFFLHLHPIFSSWEMSLFRLTLFACLESFLRTLWSTQVWLLSPLLLPLPLSRHTVAVSSTSASWLKTCLE